MSKEHNYFDTLNLALELIIDGNYTLHDSEETFWPEVSITVPGSAKNIKIIFYRIYSLYRNDNCYHYLDDDNKIKYKIYIKKFGIFWEQYKGDIKSDLEIIKVFDKFLYEKNEKLNNKYVDKDLVYYNILKNDIESEIKD